MRQEKGKRVDEGWFLEWKRERRQRESEYSCEDWNEGLLAFFYTSQETPMGLFEVQRTVGSSSTVQLVHYHLLLVLGDWKGMPKWPVYQFDICSKYILSSIHHVLLVLVIDMEVNSSRIQCTSLWVSPSQVYIKLMPYVSYSTKWLSLYCSITLECANQLGILTSSLVPFFRLSSQLHWLARLEWEKPSLRRSLKPWPPSMR